MAWKIRVRTYTPQKFNIDTKNGPYLKPESPFPRPIILGPSILVFGAVINCPDWIHFPSDPTLQKRWPDWRCWAEQLVEVPLWSSAGRRWGGRSRVCTDWWFVGSACKKQKNGFPLGKVRVDLRIHCEVGIWAAVARETSRMVKFF